MSSLDDPASGLFPATALGVCGFITPGLDVSDVAVNSFEHLSDCFGIIAFVQRDVFLQAILESWQSLSSIVNRLFQQSDVVHVGTSYSQSQRDSIGVRHPEAFVPCLAPSVGFLPVFWPLRGALVIAPSTHCRRRSNPTKSSLPANSA